MYKKYTNLGCSPRGKASRYFGAFRLPLLVILFALFNLNTAFAQKRITLKEKNAQLIDVFKKISDQTGIDFAVTSSMLANAKRVTISVSGADLNQVLKMIFKDQPLTYVINGDAVIVRKKGDVPPISVPVGTNRIPAEAVEISGNVVDEKGKPLSGTSVTVENTAIQTITNSEGKFYLRGVPSGSVLIINYVGYQRQFITINSTSVLNISMKIENTVLANVDIVNTGYQTLTKERSTGSFGKPDMALFNNRTGAMDIVSRLEGLVPGLTVIAGSFGSVIDERTINSGSSQKSIIRGQSSVTLASDPLYVVNGVPVDNYTFKTINPNDVEGITVLKDASAAAIWGSRAANGVIVVTTKSGNKDSKLRINYSGFFNFAGKPDFGYSKMMNSAQFIQAAKETFNPQLFPYFILGSSYVAPHEQIMYDEYNNKITAAQAAKSLDSLSAINNMDQIKDIWYRNAMTSNHSLSVSGGTSVYSFYSSLSYTDTRSNIPGSSNKYYRINFNQEYNPIKRLKISLATSLGNNLIKGSRPIDITDQFFPYQLFRDVNGNSISMPFVQGFTPERRADYQQRSRIDLNYNPIDEMDFGYSNSNNLSLNMTGDVTLKLLKGLSYKGTYAFQKAPGNTKSYADSKAYSLRRELLSLTVAPTPSSTPIYYLPTTGGTFIESNSEQRNFTLRNQLIYTLSLRDDKDQLNVQFGQEAREQLRTGNSTTLRGYKPDMGTYSVLDYKTLSNGIGGTVTGYGAISGNFFNVTDTRSRFTSLFALMNYNFEKGKYSIDGSWRIDHSNLFGSDKSTQNRPVWSIGGKWNISKESFMEAQTWLNTLGIRATYGITGNSPFVASGTQFDIVSPEFGMTTPIAGTGYYVSSAANDKLKWETTETTNLGVDFAVLKNRLSGSIDLYYKKTTDLLGSVKLNPLSGFASGAGNIGDLSNKGIEASIQSINISGNGFRWTTGITFAYNKNKLLSYVPVQTFLNTGWGKVSSSYYVGYGMQTIFAYKYAGLDNEGNPQIRLANGTVTKDPTISTPEDIIHMGSAIPVYSGGITNSFSYKSFTLSANMIYNFGNVMRRDINTVYSGRLPYQGGFFGNLTTYFMNRWKKPGDELVTDIPAYIASENPFVQTRNVDYYTMGDVNVVSASYIKLRDITLSYDIPVNFLSRLKIQHANIFVQATNFMIWKANKFDIDPESRTSLTSARVIPPFKHMYSIGANISF